MGLLDDLKVPAVGSHRGSADLSGFAGAARGPMREAYMFFTSFVRDISKQPPRIVVSYRLEEAGEMRDLQQGDYRISTPPNIGDIHDFTVSCVCSREGELSVPTDGSRAYIAQRSEYFRDHGLRFSFEEMYKDVWGHSKGDRMQGAFHVQRHVPVSFCFKVDADARRINLIIGNLTRIGQERLPIKLDAMTDQLFAEVAKAMLRRENRMNELAGFKVQDDVRAKLKARLASEALLKQQQLQQNEGQKPHSFFANLFGRHRDKA